MGGTGEGSPSGYSSRAGLLGDLRRRLRTWTTSSRRWANPGFTTSGRSRVANGQQTSRSWGSGAVSCWHPLLVYGKGTKRLPGTVRDFFQGGGAEKASRLAGRRGGDGIFPDSSGEGGRGRLRPVLRVGDHPGGRPPPRAPGHRVRPGPRRDRLVEGAVTAGGRAKRKNPGKVLAGRAGVTAELDGDRTKWEPFRSSREPAGRSKRAGPGLNHAFRPSGPDSRMRRFTASGSIGPSVTGLQSRKATFRMALDWPSVFITTRCQPCSVIVAWSACRMRPRT